MKRPIDPLRLLEQADELGYRGKGPGQPRNINLRRAASSAYYALFHDLTASLGELLVPAGSAQERSHLGRLVKHDSLKEVSTWVLGTKPPRKVRVDVSALRADPELVAVAQAFVDLQEARHEADYDNEADFTKARTLSLVDQARDAIDRCRRCRATDTFQLFLALVALHRNTR